MFQSFDLVNAPEKSATRVESLRQELILRGFDGFLVPHADEYMNEYLPAHNCRLEWLTGFSGSAGLAIILPKMAALFVDGRYKLQVQQQVDQNIFNILDFRDNSPSSWLTSYLYSHQKIAFDPKLHSIEEINRLRIIAAQNGAHLIPCLDNPIDVVWKDRPLATVGYVMLHPLEIAGYTAQEKINRLLIELEKENVDALIVTQTDNIAWLLNIRGNDIPHTPVTMARLIVDRKSGLHLFIDSHKLLHPIRETLSKITAIYAEDMLQETLHKLSEKKCVIRIDPQKSSDWFHTQIEGKSAKIQFAGDPINLMKAQKNEVEIAGARAAHLRDGIAMTKFLFWISKYGHRGEITEISAARKLEEFRMETGMLHDLAFDTISAVGSHAAFPHYRVSHATDRKIEKNEIFLIDSGAQYRDGTTDITRTLIIGQPTEEMRYRFTCVLQAHIAVATARFPEGTQGIQIDSFARRPLWDAGLDFDHGTGHGVGSFLSVHEGPISLSKNSRIPLLPGMILSNEPGYYKSGSYGIRLENLMLVCHSAVPAHGERPMLHFETLSLAPIDRNLIIPDILTFREIGWVDYYHAAVRSAILPHLDAEAQNWVETATAPLLWKT